MSVNTCNDDDDETICLVSEKPKGSSWFAASFIIINAALGAAILEFPEAYHLAGGAVFAMSIQAFMLVFIVGGLLILAYCSDVELANNYQEVIANTCGYWGGFSCSFFIALYCFGTCITFLIIIGDQWDEVFKIVFRDGDVPWYFGRQFTISISSVIVIFPLCFFKRIDFLAKISAVGVLGILYLAFFIVIKYFAAGFCAQGIKTKPDSWTDVFLVIPSITFGYQCHVSAVPVYACLRKRCIPEFAKTIAATMITCVAVYSTTAMFGYWSFGSKIGPDVLDCYEHPTWDVTLGVALLAIKTYTTYPILQYCGRIAIESMFKTRTDGSAGGCFRIIITVTWFVLTLLIALLAKNIKQVIDVLGSLASVFIFIYPGLCLIQVYLLNQHRMAKHFKFGIVTAALLFEAMGMLILGITISQQIQKLF